MLYMPSRHAPSAINSVLHETCGILTGLLCESSVQTRLLASESKNEVE